MPEDPKKPSGNQPERKKKKISIEELRGRRIGRILVKLGKVTREQVQEGLDLQKHQRRPLGQILIDLGMVTEADVNKALAAQSGMKLQSLEGMEIPEEAIKALPAETAQAYQVMPLKYDPDSNTLTVALKDPNNFRAIDDLKLLMGFTVKTVVADPAEVEAAIKRHYSESESIASLIGPELADDESLSVLDGRDQSIDLDELVAAIQNTELDPDSSIGEPDGFVVVAFDGCRNSATTVLTVNPIEQLRSSMARKFE